MPVPPLSDGLASPAGDAGQVGRVGQVAVAGSDGVQVRFDRRGSSTEIELSDTTGRPAEPTLVRSVADAIAVIGARPEIVGTDVHLAADHPAGSLDPLPEAVADAVGFGNRRDLLQLRRALPIPDDHPTRASAPSVEMRPFRSDLDGPAWIRANNRAFATHPDQGRETDATLAARLAAPWFDSAGFLVADDASRPGELSGFCWTKVHGATAADAARGEIYVIGVDPSHRGEGLGPAFVLAGLDHLAAGGLITAMLYVDADNDTARRLYDRFGFTTHQRRRVYTP